MNIDEYRAMKAQMDKESKEDVGAKPKEDVTTKPEPVVAKPSEPKPVDAPKEDVKPTEPKEEPKVPEFIEINGEKVSIDELRNGYLRQSDYTKKTQQLKRKEQQLQDAIKFINELQKHPQVAQTLAQQFNIPTIDPKEVQMMELQDRYFELLITTELDKLHKKYGDFNDAELLDLAREKGIDDLEVAYHMLTSKGGGATKKSETPNIEDLKKQLREELLEELKREQMAQVDTGSIVGTGGSAPKSAEPVLSQLEIQVARNMGMTPQEYAKWRDAGKKKR